MGIGFLLLIFNRNGVSQLQYLYRLWFSLNIRTIVSDGETLKDEITLLFSWRQGQRKYYVVVEAR